MLKYTNTCTKENPMPLEVLEHPSGMEEIWYHVDSIETEESKLLDGNTIFVYCPNCKVEFTVCLPD